MKILVIGSGGREHALCWKLAKSPLVTRLYCAPGNGGIAGVAECVDVKALDFDGILAFCRATAIEFVVVAPDDPLALGLVDLLEAEGIPAFGPTAAAAKLESSKGFTKELCSENNIPTAAYARFSDAAAARAYVEREGAPIVIKADGLAAGKGVIVAMSLDEALAAIDDIFGGRFGSAGAEVVVEAFLEGEEASFFALCDGETALELATAQDHKRAFDNDQGPNTGGMGAYSPAPVLDEATRATVMERFINPTLAAMKRRGTPFKGILYLGLMMTKTGPQLIEYNARFGDPECQVLMMRLKSDLLPALIAAREGRLKDITLEWSEDPALTVVMATKGYPGDYPRDTEIKGLDALADQENVTIFHAGTRRESGRTLATGGRVLNITATGKTVAEARDRAYAIVEKINWPEGFYRTDIGWRAIARENEKPA